MACNDDSEARSPMSGQGALCVKKSDHIPDLYNMNHKDRGHAVILSNRLFDNEELGERVGTDVDIINMSNVLKNVIGFDEHHIVVHHDATAAEMKDFMLKASKEDYTECDCFIGVILTHGSDEGQLWGTDEEIDLRELVDPFKGDNCESLKGKPKVFFIQACQGEELDIGTTTTVEKIAHDASYDEDESETDSTCYKEGMIELRFSTEADFIIAYSCVPGSRSWRDVYKGSWYIQTLCDVITEEWSREDLLSMLTKVNKKVTYDFENIVIKQMPCFTSMLTKKLFFHIPSTS